jgi:hypothetical protein
MWHRERTLSYLSDEYKILQDKLDKIGAFRYTIKGWSVTAAVGGLIAGATGKGHSAIIAGIVLDICLLWFFWFEREQVVLSRKFGKRARDIEREVDSARKRLGWQSQYPAPRIASTLAGRKPFELITHQFSSRQREALRMRTNEEVRIARSADLLFYLALMILAWLPVFFHPEIPQPATVNLVIGGQTSNTEPSLSGDKSANDKSLQKQVEKQTGSLRAQQEVRRDGK